MTTLIILSLYIASVFLNRWINKILYIKGIVWSREPIVWMLSLIGTAIFLIIVVFKTLDGDNWFTGKNWKQKE